MASVYIETTVVSYLTAWPSNDLTRAGQQRATQLWWDVERLRFDVFTSELVFLESAAGDAVAASERLAVLAPLALLTITDSAEAVADSLVAGGAIPAVASRDALHVGICATSGIDYLLTWNFKHLANASLRNRISDVCEAHGYDAPVICTPDELF